MEERLERHKARLAAESPHVRHSAIILALSRRHDSSSFSPPCGPMAPAQLYVWLPG